MKNICKATAVCLLVLAFNVHSSLAQQLSPEASKLKSIYVQLKIYPGSKPKQLAFIKAFPENKQQFTAVFEPAGSGQLHSDSYSYISTFVGAATGYSTEVIDKLIVICKDVADRSDASKQMQKSLIDLGLHYPKVFGAKVKTLSAHDADNLARFMADMDDVKDNTSYQGLIEALDKANETSFANKLLDARVKREK
jgi:hypothetical protein